MDAFRVLGGRRVMATSIQVKELNFQQLLAVAV
jgi:hypothetical protein